MLYKLKENKLESIAFEDFGSIGRKEKELENIFAQNLEMIYGEYGVLFPVFQERPGQEAPDLCALDKEGNLIIFEFKRSEAPESTTNQIMRYAEIYGQKSYDDLNSIYKKYISKKNGQDNMELVDAISESEQNPVALSTILQLLLGREQKKRLYDHLRTETGTVPVEAVSTAIADIFSGCGTEGKN